MDSLARQRILPHQITHLDILLHIMGHMFVTLKTQPKYRQIAILSLCSYLLVFLCSFICWAKERTQSMPDANCGCQILCMWICQFCTLYEVSTQILLW
uniref:Nicotiana tabacum ORF n=1 Tax=Nicotiana tabacum TaxID=4097 RepID=P93383_TOBAC|nr:ORF; able to induce HR-like lesions [Nicotiana tabacum]